MPPSWPVTSANGLKRSRLKTNRALGASLSEGRPRLCNGPTRRVTASYSRPERTRPESDSERVIRTTQTLSYEPRPANDAGSAASRSTLPNGLPGLASVTTQGAPTKRRASTCQRRSSSTRSPSSMARMDHTPGETRSDTAVVRSPRPPAALSGPGHARNPAAW